jgi:quinol monooxygenase YgiN
MTAIVLFDIQIQTNKLGQLQDMLRTALVDTANFEGCQGIYPLRNEDDPYNVVLRQLWDSRAHFESYVAWREKTGFTSELFSCFAHPPSVRHFEEFEF